jgi:gliding motility-associated-like protein
LRLLRYIIFALLVGSSLISGAQTTFEVVNPSGCAPFGAVIHVEVPTSGNSFLWEITTPSGNIITSTSTTYVSIFTIPGTYDVSLTVNGSSTETVEDYITVFAPPIASFAAESPIGCVPHCTNFINSSIEGTSPIISYNWDFGDGYTSTEQNPNHCYQDVGNYSPILSITDTNGCFSNLSIVSHIQIPINSVIANFTASNLVTCETPAIINFNNSSTGNDDIISFWNFGDGSAFSTPNLLTQTHEYDQDGVFNVCLFVVDEYGCSDEMCQEIQVIEQPLPTASANDYTTCTNESIQFQVISSNPINNIAWDFDSDGAIDSNELNPLYIFEETGSYLTTAIVSHENGCIQTVELPSEILVNPVPVGSIMSNELSSCVVPFTPSISVTTSEPLNLSYSWFVNDISVGTGTTLLFPFEESGSYDVSVEIQNNSGCIATLLSEDFIQINSPQIGLVHYSTACIGQDFTPTDFVIITPSQVTDYSWDFDGDGIEDSSDSLPTFVYNELGEYSLSLEIQTADGCNAIYHSETPIQVIDILTTEFTTNFTETCAAQFIQFCAPEETLNTYSWNYGSNNSWLSTNSNDNCVEYTYEDTGYFNIRVRVTRGACITIDTLPEFIHIAAPVALFTLNVSCDDHLTVTLYDESIGATELEWDFGDNSDHIFNETIVTHTYSSFGNYQIRLTASDGNDACDYTEVHTVRLQEADASVSFSTTEGCAPLFVTFEETTFNNYWEVEISNGDSFIADWNGGPDWWEITYNHDGESEEYTVPEGEEFWPNFQFNEAGCYDFTFTVYDRYNCPDVQHYDDVVCVLSNSNFAEFEYSSLNLCDPVELSFSPISQQLVSTVWSFGDGEISTSQNPSHIFLPPFDIENGFSVTLFATDNNGCQSTVTNNIEVSLPSVPSFSISSSSTCLGQEISFSSTTLGEVQEYYWTFGDDDSGSANSSTSNSPVHTYNQNGIYEVCLTVVSPSGCERTYCDANAVDISTPAVNFTYASAMNNCLYGVQFSSTSLGNNSQFEWDFGDNQTGYGQSVFHTYPIGVFDVTLIVTGNNGCIDSLSAEDIFSYGNQIGPYSTIVEELNCAPFHVEFQAYAPTDSYFTYFWDFNDGYGIPAGEVSVSHDYLSAGSFCPQLIMTDPNGCEVFVPCENPIQVEDFEMFNNIPSEICFGDSVGVILGNADSFDWNNTLYVEEGITPSDFVIHPDESVDFIITGTLGDCQSIDTIHVEVNPLPLVALSLPDQVCVDAEIFELSGGVPIASTGIYSTDGMIITTFNPQQNSNEWYVIKYEYSDSNQCVNYALDSIFVRPLPNVVLPEFNSLCLNSEPLLLEGGSPISGDYIIGDSTITVFDPSIGVGEYEINYRYTDSIGCVSSAQTDLFVLSIPNINLSFDSVCVGAPFEIVNNSNIDFGEISSTEWTFGLGATITGQNPGILSFADSGENTFHVKLESLEGCITERDTTVYVFDLPQSLFSIEDGCANSDLQFVSESLPGEGEITFLSWSYSGEIIGSNDTLIYEFMDWGSPTLTLITETNHGCTDTLDQQVSVYPLPEVEAFTSDVCLGQNTVFTSVADVAYGLIDSFQWSIGDSVLAAGNSSVGFQFSEYGFYTAHLLVQTDYGCIGTDSVSTYINNVPDVEFAVEQPGYCPESDVYLFDFSSIDSQGSYLTEWSWYFDGDLVSTEANPVINLVDIASYDVTLSTTTNFGCTSELTMENFITVYPKPQAGFAVENIELNMAQPFVEVVNLSSNDVTSWNYDFGDGTIESFESGVHEYLNWTNYSIIQTVSNVFGCTDTASYSVTVLPSIIVNIPNAFTPDGNGHNDLFFPVLYGSEILFFEFDIYDRWGRLMYEAASTEDGWDGTIRESGEMAPCGVYNWKMSIRTVDQPLIKQTMGSVMLIK